MLPEIIISLTILKINYFQCFRMGFYLHRNLMACLVASLLLPTSHSCGYFLNNPTLQDKMQMAEYVLYGEDVTADYQCDGDIQGCGRRMIDFDVYCVMKGGITAVPARIKIASHSDINACDINVLSYNSRNKMIVSWNVLLQYYLIITIIIIIIIIIINIIIINKNNNYFCNTLVLFFSKWIIIIRIKILAFILLSALLLVFQKYFLYLLLINVYM